MKYIILIIPLILGGCFWNSKPNIQPPLDTKTDIPADLKQECPPIDNWQDQTFGTILQHDINTSIKYAECRKKHKELVEAIDKQK